MENDFNAFDRSGDRQLGFTRSPSTNSTCLPIGAEIVAIAGAQIVEHPHTVAALDQRLRDVRTNESCAASY